MFGLIRRSKPTRQRSLPPGERVYAVGDVHGRADLLRPLLAAIVESARGAGRATAVFLGDYVDRGRDSRDVIDALLDFHAHSGLQTRFLRGNHDDTLLRFLEDARVGPTWIDYGGAETLESYGAPMPATRHDADAWEDTRRVFAERLGARHRAFFEGLELSCEIGDYFFAHAGARPGVPLEAQTAQDLMWIRSEFLKGRGGWDKTVVHGHTPEEAAVLTERRIGVDTGAYATGRLTAVVLEGADRRLLQAVAAQGRVEIEGRTSSQLEASDALN